MNIAARRVPGAMAVAALATCALFATATGIVGALVTLMGLLAFPAMLRAGYSTTLSAGVICAGGCLGILIPPSIMLIVYGATSGVSVVRLYAGAMFPGFLLAGLYIVYDITCALLNPALAPKPPKEQTDISHARVAYMVVTGFVPLAVLIVAVLGAILFGLATPTEAAAMGALGGLHGLPVWTCALGATAAAAPPPLPPRLGFVRTAAWEEAEPDTHKAFAELVERLGDAVEEYKLPDAFGQIVTWHRAILEADRARSFDREYHRGRDRLSPALRGTLERGQQVRAVDYLLARDQIASLNPLLQDAFDRYDALVTPAAPGEAPLGLDSTGSPTFCTIWTFCGTPAVSLPLLEGSHGLPMAAQLVAARGDDARLLRTACWLVRSLAA